LILFQARLMSTLSSRFSKAVKLFED
jgi:hypothetical protein